MTCQSWKKHTKLGKSWDSNRFKIKNRGAFGKVRVVEHKVTKESFACKLIKKRVGSTSMYEQLQKELVIMKKVRHPHIVQLYEVYETPKTMYMIME